MLVDTNHAVDWRGLNSTPQILVHPTYLEMGTLWFVMAGLYCTRGHPDPFHWCPHEKREAGTQTGRSHMTMGARLQGSVMPRSRPKRGEARWGAPLESSEGPSRAHAFISDFPLHSWGRGNAVVLPLPESCTWLPGRGTETVGSPGPKILIIWPFAKPHSRQLGFRPWGCDLPCLLFSFGQII